MNVKEAIIKRRSMRSFLPEPIPEEVLREVLEAGRLAPSGGNGQNCYFLVVTDEARKQQLAEASGNQMWIAEAPVVIALCSRVDYDLATMPEDDFGLEVNRLRFGRGLIEFLNKYEDRRAMGRLWTNGCALIPGAQMSLAATAHGLDTCWIGYLDVDRANEILKLPEEMACLFLLPVGYAAEEPKRSSRKPHDEVVFHETWEGK